VIQLWKTAAAHEGVSQSSSSLAPRPRVGRGLLAPFVAVVTVAGGRANSLSQAGIWLGLSSPPRTCHNNAGDRGPCVGKRHDRRRGSGTYNRQRAACWRGA